MRIAFVALIALACTHSVVGPRPYDPGHAQRRAAELVTECTGTGVDARDVDWFTLDSLRLDTTTLGQWHAPNVIEIDERYIANVYLSMHELVHYAIGENDTEHRNAWWMCLPEGWR